METGILSNVNLTPLGPFVEDALACTTYFTGHNQFMSELLDQQSPLYQHKDLNVLFLHLDGEELLKDGFYALDAGQAALAHIENVLQALGQFAAVRKDVLIIISTIVFPPFHFTTSLDTASENSYRAIKENINGLLRRFTKEHANTGLLDFERLVLLHGYNQLYDEKFWYLGRIRYNNTGFELLAGELRDYLAARGGRAKKVLVLDLDNTLWGGVIGEDGLGGIALSEDGEGKAYRDFQKALYSLKALGVLFAIDSKNNEADAKEAFDKHPMMVFKYDDFVAKRINWDNKAANLAALAQELNLGLDSMVFIDDSPMERSLMRKELPEVTVPEMPQDKTLLKKWFLTEVVSRYFSRTQLTGEDRNKTVQYQANIKRQAVQRQLNMADFLKKLSIKLQYPKNDASLKNRIAQLTQKTNQFNLRTVRYTDADIENLLGDKNTAVYGLSYKDTFGDEGVIGAAIVRLAGKECVLDTFLLSCRVLGRNVEYNFMQHILADLKGTGAEHITAEFIPSAKNSVAENFYRACGFPETGKNAYGGDITQIQEALQKKLTAAA